MVRELAHIEPLRTATMTTLLYYLFALPFIGYHILDALLHPQAGNAVTVAMDASYHFVYGLLMFACMLVGIACYNLIARRFGGIRFTLNDK